MNPTKLLIVKVGFALITVVCIAFVVWGIYKSLKRSGIEDAKLKRTFTFMGIGIVAWVLILSALSLSGVFRDFSTFPPKAALSVILPLIVLTTLIFSKKVQPLLDSMPPQWPLFLQSFRIPVEIMLWLGFAGGFIPVQMTFEGLNFDVLSGILGPLMAIFAFSGVRDRKGWAIAYNIAGLLLLINIVVIAILSMPTPVRQFMNDPANTMVAEFPVIFLPGILVPLAYALHIFSLRQLLRKGN